MRRTFCSLREKTRLILCLFAGFSILNVDAGVLISEILYDPYEVGLEGDANNDGVSHIFNDEFVEIVNTTTNTIDISGWILRHNTNALFTFPSAVLSGLTAAVVFRGGSPSGTFGGALVFTSGGSWQGLSSGLPNTGGVVSLFNPFSGVTNDAVDYSTFPANINESITRFPEIAGTNFVRHTTVNPCSRRFSPGTQFNGKPFPGSPVTNAPPCIQPVADAFTQVGRRVDVVVSAVDADGQPVSLSVGGTPAEAVFIDNMNGTGLLIYTGQLVDAGATFGITVFASDSEDTASLTFELYVVEAPYTGLVINEYLANPIGPGGSSIDANNDGVTNSVQDEFVEIVNNTGGPVNVGGFRLSDATSLRHVFRPQIIPDGGSIVVFGGGDILFFTNPPAAIVSQGGVDGLGLANSGDSIILHSPATTLVDRVDYSSSLSAVSATRHPEAEGPFISHLIATTNASRASPGRRSDGLHFLTNQPPILVPVSAKTVSDGNTLSFPIRAYDPADHDVITMTASNMPANAYLSSNNGHGTFHFTPDSSQVGQTYDIDIYASDVDGFDLLTFPVTVLSTDVVEIIWINEIHYDNEGTDIDEGIEIVGVVGLDLSSYWLLPYDGTDFQPEWARSNSLSGYVFPNEQCGFGAIWIPFGVNQLENDREGIALIKGDQVIQFLSYEGSFTAIGGPADGMTSEDIGVAESGTTPVGYSLQLIGTGSTYSAFTWAGPRPHSRGTLNAGQQIDACGGELVLFKSVYAGHDGGTTCPGGLFIQGLSGDPITFCFAVSNSGSVMLNDVELSDPFLPGFGTVTLGSMAPGAVTNFIYETFISGDVTNLASVVGIPPFGSNAMALASAVVDQITPSLLIEKTVYHGHDSGISLPGMDLIYATNNSAITFGFYVLNDGDIPLDNVMLSDGGISGFGTTNLGTLLAGQDMTVYMETYALDSHTNIATVTAIPPAGLVLLVEDSAVVIIIEPSLRVEKTVYIGHDNGASCPGLQFIQGTNGLPITYCITVENDGNTPLFDVEIIDAQIGMAPVYIGAMTNGQSVAIYVETVITASMINTAFATGYDINNEEQVFSNTAEVERIFPPAECEYPFEVIDLGDFGGSNSWAYGINSIGQIAGSAENEFGLRRAFIWEEGAFTDLGVLTGGLYSVATAINNLGEVTGFSDRTGVVDGQQIETHAFRYSNGVMMDLGTLGGKASAGWGINDAGDVAGWAYRRFQNFNINPMLHTKGTNINLETFNGVDDSGQAYGLNNHTQVVGFAFAYYPPAGVNGFLPFVWRDVNGNLKDDPGDMIPLGTFGGNHGVAFAINDQMQITGGADKPTANVRHAFIINPIQTQTGTVWFVDDDNDSMNDLMEDIGTLPGHLWAEGFDINENQVVVGRSGFRTGPFRAFLYKNNSIVDLNLLIDSDSGWTLETAMSINDNGWIVGYGSYMGRTRAFLLKPCLIGANPDDFRILRVVTSDHDYYVVTLVWPNLGPAYRYWVEVTGDVQGQPAWSIVNPTNQWPLLSTFLPVRLEAEYTTRVYRIRAELD